MHGGTRGRLSRLVRRGQGRALILAVAIGWSVAACAKAAPIAAADPVTSQRFEITYAVNRDAEPLQVVELWYTRDSGQTWHLFGVDEDRHSPIAFTAPGEGIYGLTLVLYNAAGASSPRPRSGTEAQKWILVDYTPPVLQLHQARVTGEPGAPRRVQVSWSAYDAHLPPRPIELSYRLPDQGLWTSIEDRLANVGVYDWIVPEQVSGDVEIRCAVRDRAGHVTVREFSPITIDPPEAGCGEAATAKANQPAASPGELVSPGSHPMPSPANVAQAEKLYALGSWHLLRGQLDVAKERLREALALDPGHKAARNDLAGILYRQGAYTAAADTYQSVLQEDETFVPALRGLALALAAQKRYPEAAATLQRILAVNESDPQTLLELGDVLLLGGDPEAARGHWRDATRQPSVSAEILRDARKRLAAVSTQSVK